MKPKLLVTSLLMAGMAAACTVVVLEDLEVEWSVAGYADTQVCDDFGIAFWEVEAVGPEKVTKRFDCAATPLSPDNNWYSEDWLYDVEAGTYDVTVYALDATAGVLAERSVTLSTSVPASSALIDFTEADFDGTVTPAKAKLTFYWNINGTQDGTDYGPSWDTCDEVGAAQIAVTLDGVESTYDCDASGEMKMEVEVEEGDHTVNAVLLDSAGQALTTEAGVVTVAATAATPGEYSADFYAPSFFDGEITGDFWFTTSFEGVSYDATNPNVYNQISLIQLDGAGLNPAPEVCGPDNECYAADGGAFGGVYTPTDILKIKTVKWGFYTLLLQGTLDQAAGNEICWESRDCTPVDTAAGKYCNTAANGLVDIVIGAGVDNPTLDFDLERINTDGYCAAM